MAVKKKAKKAKKARAAGGKRASSRKARPARAAKKSRTGRQKAAKAPPGVSQERMMAAWQKAAAPGEGHRRLDALAGNWMGKTTFWVSPDAPPSTSDGTSEHRWVLGGRYLEQVYRGAAMGAPFEGMGYTGYDNVQQRYVGTWMDSMTTGIMTSLSTGRPRSDTIAFTSRSYDPVSRKEVLFESMIRIQDRDHHTYEMWTRSPGGKRFRTMLVEYTRQS